MFTDHAGATRSCIIVRDITDRHRLETELWELALVDELTGLHNRRAFMLLAEHPIKEAVRAGRPVIGLFADVDDLKIINDTYGHPEGDRALRRVADALRAACRDADIVGRLSGDEFAILLAETHQIAGIEARVRRRLTDATRDLPYPLCVSIGVARCLPGEHCDLDELFARADQAMYEEKTAKRHATQEALGRSAATALPPTDDQRRQQTTADHPGPGRFQRTAEDGVR